MTWPQRAKFCTWSHFPSPREEVQRQTFKPNTLVGTLQSCLSFDTICAFLHLGHYESSGSPLLGHTDRNLSRADTQCPLGDWCVRFGWWIREQGCWERCGSQGLSRDRDPVELREEPRSEFAEGGGVCTEVWKPARPLRGKAHAPC